MSFPAQMSSRKTTSARPAIHPLVALMMVALLAGWTNLASAAPLTGTKNIPGDYATLAAAITDLNTQGVGAGGVTLNLLAGNPQTAPAGGYVVGGTGSAVLTTSSASNPVIIQGNANTITAFTPQTSGNLNDAIFKLIGADWITIQNFTMQENPANTTTAAATNNMTEWGVALLYVTTTDGAQNNTIQNNTITLNRTYTNTFGVYSNTRHSSTAVTTSAEVTAASGSNSNNKVYGNAISGVNYGIVFIGAGTTIAAIDSGNDIGGSSAATGNTITNCGGGAAASGYISLTGNNYIIFDNQQINDNVSFNTITTAALTSSVTVGGILKNYSIGQPTGTITTTINNNTVTVTNNPSAATTGSIIGINNQGLTPLLSTATMSMNNNIVQNCVLGGSTSTTNSLSGITNLSLPGTLNMTGNSVINNAITATTATSGLVNGLSNSGAAGTVNMNNNIVRGFASTATSGQIQGITNSGAVVTALNINNNQLGNASGGFFSTSTVTSGSLFGISTSGGAATCALSIQSNDIRGISYNNATVATAAQNYIQNTAATLSQNISSNTFTNLNVFTTGSVIFIADSVSAPSGGSKTVNGNSIVTAFNKGGAGGTVTLYSDGGSSTATAGVTNNNNNFSNLTVTGSTTVAGWFNNDGTGGTPAKTITGNTFNNWTCGTGTVNVLQSNFGNPGSISNNTITNITGQGIITGLAIGSSGTVSALNVASNTITGLSSTASGGAVTGISNAVSSTTTANINGNTINNLSSTSTTATVAGISTSASANIFSNTINTLTCLGTTSGVTNGIMVTGGAAGNVFKNKICDLSTTGAFSTTPGVNGIVLSGSTSAVTRSVYNNLIGDLKAPASISTDAIRGISITATGTTSTYNIYYNTVYMAASSTGATFGTSGIFHAASSTSTTAALNLRNNAIINGSTPSGVTGFTVAFRRSSGTAGTLANYASTSNNNDFYAGTPGASNLIYSDGTSTATTMAAYQAGVFTAGTIAPRDAASFTENPTFLSVACGNANFLHIDTTVATLLESGGATISGITDDYDGDTRNVAAPDVGADEFNGFSGVQGACCLPTGCIQLSQTACTNQGAGGTWQQGVACPGNCPPTGRCCDGNGNCSVRTEASCLAFGNGAVWTSGADCSTPCVTGTCCTATGTCSIKTEAGCTAAGGYNFTSGATCGANSCPIGACCVNGVCTQVVQAACTGSWTEGQACGGVNTFTAPAAQFPAAIPDNNPTGVTTSLTISSSFTITDLNLKLNIAHTWYSDAVVKIKHVDTGTTVAVIPGTPSTASTDLIAGNWYILDDEATTTIDAAAAAATSTIPLGSYKPMNPLSAFDGENALGTWQVIASDDAAGIAGTLNGWALDIDGAPNPCVPRGACCIPTGCTYTDQATCTSLPGSTAWTEGVQCQDAGCPPTGRCCTATGTCSMVTQAACLATTGNAWDGNLTCSTPCATGACCLANGICVVRTAAGCAAINGCYQGDNESCTSASPTTYTGGGVPVAIPDNSTTGVTLSLVVSDSYSIADLDMQFLFGSPAHSWYDDVNMRLTHVDTGTTVLLLSGSGSDSSDLCGPYTLDDAAALTLDAAAAAETTGTACIPSGSYRPDNALSAFNGENVNGTWRLLVWDDAAGDTGTLQSWSLSASASRCPNIASQPVNVTACVTGSASFTVGATGTGLTYQWRKGGNPLSNGGNISGADGPTLTINPVSAADAGSYDVVVTSGNCSKTSNAATLSIDSTNPSFSGCPGNIGPVSTDTGLCSAVVSWTAPTASDNCPNVAVSADHNPGDTFPVGTTTVTYTATDTAGNTATCSFSVTVVDGENPTIAGCPTENITVNNDAGLCTAVVSWTAPTASDNCPGVMLSSNHNPGDAFPVGSTTVTYTATDAAGHTATCSFTVTVVDAENPAIANCPADIGPVSTDPGQAYATVSWTPPTASDNCPNVMLSSNHNPGDQFPVGVTSVTYTATDAAGHVVTCSFSVTVQDTEFPVIIGCPKTITVDADAGLCTAVVSWTEPTVTDNQPGATINQTQGPASGSAFPVGTTHIRYTAIDASGNTSYCDFDVIVVDSQNPTISGCPAENITVNNDAGLCTAVVSWTAPTAADNCPGVMLSSNYNPGDTFPVGTTTVTYTATDAAGHTATCSFTVTVVDTDYPAITGCPENITVNNQAGLCSAVANWTAPTASDNCLGVVLSSNYNPGDTFPVGDTTVTYTATDGAGHMAMCSFTVTVLDAENPAIAGCPENITVNNEAGLCSAVVNWTAPTASDNCPGVMLSSNYNPGDTFPVGTTTVTYTATDGAGHTATCSFTVTVVDAENPAITGCPENIGPVNNDAGLCSAAVSWTAPTASDNCSGVMLSSNYNPGDTFPVGTTTVTYTATDGAGHTATCSFTVTVVDSENPVIHNCPANITSGSNAGNCTAVVSWTEPTVTDNCEGATIVRTQGPAPGSTFGNGSVTTIEYTATDASMHTSVCSFTVSVVAVPDVNNDGFFDINDVGPFANVLLGVDTNPLHVLRADVNCDGVADGRDVSPFVHLLAP